MAATVGTGRFPSPVELVPAEMQRWWRTPAVANFALGGLGAGFYMATAVASAFVPSPSVAVAAVVGPVLVFAGFAAVAAEAGRPFRGARVLTRVRSSWMSRELVFGGVFAAAAVVDLALPARPLRIVATVAAALLVLAQGLILKNARGVPAWSVGIMPALFLVSSAVAGTGALLVVDVACGAVLVLGFVAWLAFLTWSQDPAFTRAIAPLAEGKAALELCGAGYVVPFALAALALTVPGIAAPTAVLAGALMIVGQVRAKAMLLLRAGQLRPITLRITRRLP